MEIEIPFGAKDSELMGWEYTIPEDMEAVIKDGKVIVKKKDSEDEKIRKEILDFIRLCLSRTGFGSRSIAIRKEDAEMFKKWIAYLEKRKFNTDGDFARGYDCGYECCLNSHGAEYLEKQKKPNYCHHEVDLSGCSEEYSKGYYDGWNNCNQQHSQLEAEQKPAEWSEEDEERLERVDDLLWMLDDYLGDDCSICEERTTRLREEIKNVLCPFLKSLRPQPKEELAKMLRDEYNKGKEAGEREGYTKGYDKGYKDANESVSYHFPVMPTTPSGFGCDGTHCINPFHDCINCPTRFSTLGTIEITNSN